MLKRRKKNPLLLRPGFWFVSVLLVLFCLASWWLWLGRYRASPRFNALLIQVNQEPRRILAGETVRFHPRDRVQVLEISTNIPLNRGVRLACRGLDVNAFLNEPTPLSNLLPEQEIFEHYDFRIWVKYRNQDLGYLDWQVQPYVEDWLDKANRIINGERRLAFLEKALAFVPANQALGLRLLEERKSAGQWDRVAEMLEQRLREAPSRALLDELLEAHSHTSGPEGRLSVLRRIVEMEPDDLEARARLARLLEESGDRHAAVKVYEAVAERVAGEERLGLYKHLGYLHMELGQLDEAVQYYLQASKLDQRDANLYYNLAYLFEKLGDQEKADFYLANAVTLQAEDVDGRLKLAVHLLDRNELRKAEQYLREILERRPDSLEALLLTVQILEKQGRRAEARETYRRLLRLDPENPTIAFNLAALEYESGELDASLANFRKYLESNPRDQKVHAILFDIYRQQGKEAEAFAQAGLLAELNPKEIAAYRYMFERLEAQKAYARIVEVMKKGLEVNPGQLELREYLLLAYIRLGDDQGSMQQLEEMLKIRPADAKLWLSLARLREKNGQPAPAQEAYRRVIELTPGNQEAEEAYLRLRLQGVGGDGAAR